MASGHSPVRHRHRHVVTLADPLASPPDLSVLLHLKGGEQARDKRCPINYIYILKKKCLCTVTWTCAVLVCGSGLVCPPLVTGGFGVLGVEMVKQEEEETLEALCLGFWSGREQMEEWTVQYSSPGRLRRKGSRAHTHTHPALQLASQAYNYTPTHTMSVWHVLY